MPVFYLPADYSQVDQRLRELGYTPAEFGTRKVSVEDRVPLRLIYRYEDRGGLRLEVIVMNLHEEELIPQLKPFHGAPGAEARIQARLDEAERPSRPVPSSGVDRCQGCNHHPGETHHPCPFKSDIRGDQTTLCNCCGACRRNCADEV